jgi:signal transduction histidine kinase
MPISATIARARVDRLIGRTFAAGAIALSIESGLNFVGQIHYLNQALAWPLTIILWGTTIALTYSFWFGKANYLYLRIHALYMVVLVFSWPLVISAEVPQDGSFYPWIWWGIDTGWIAVALSFSWRFALVYYVSLIGVVQFMFSLPIGGSHQETVVLTDAIYTFLTNASISVIALMIRYAADRSDKANSEAIKAEVLQAEAEARAKERVRLDGLIHDSVLTALISATQAKSDEEVKASAELAGTALRKLSEAQNLEGDTESVYCSELFDSIILAAERIDPQIRAKKNCTTSISVDSEAVSALTEATLQAIHNSIMHAGPKASRELSLKSSKAGIKVVILDDGKGFRVSQVNRGRLGIKTSIIGRMQSVGGSAHVVSQPGQGTTVVLEWSNR